MLAPKKLTRFFVLGMPAAKTAVLLVNEPVAVRFLVLRRCVVATFALGARQNNQISHRLSCFALGGLALLPRSASSRAQPILSLGEDAILVRLLRQSSRR